MSKLRYSLLLLASLSLGAQAYPGMQPKDHNQIQSSVDKINVLPHSFPLEVVPFQDKTGSQLDFSQHKGKVVLVNIWATWCPPCVRELPALERLEEQFSDKEFALLPISIDQGGQEQVASFLQSQGMANFHSYYDPQMQLGQIFPLDTIPATFILNGKGELIAFVRSFVDWDDPKAIALLKGFIEQENAPKSAAN